jgi:class 3 adenylate cyclase
MQDALTRHDEILRAAVEASGGHVFKMVGDACCAAFATAREALGASLAAQRALLAEPWDQRCRLRVRMALHTGAAEERDGDYFGPPANRVARLLSTGHGGQVLLSGVTQGLVRGVLGHLEPGAELRDLGEHQLRDLKYTERIYQLAIPDLPKEFPSLKTYKLVTPAHGGAEARPPSPPPPRSQMRPPTQGPRPATRENATRTRVSWAAGG